jgi:hypothetical protein
MRRSRLPLTVVPSIIVAVALVATTAVAGPESPSGGAAPADAATAQPATAASLPGFPAQQLADEIDLTTVIPALQDTFGERYGGYWIEARHRREVMHVAVVGATADDEATVQAIAGGDPRVRTDAVTHGYDDLLAAQEEIALSLDPAAGHFTVDLDVPTNRVVVQTASPDVSGTEVVAADAARRGAQERGDRRRRERPGRPGPRTEPAPGAGTAPPTDLATAVVVEPDAAIEVRSAAGAAVAAGPSRGIFPPAESGLATVVNVGGWLFSCTTGLEFVNGFGYFTSTAGHCGRVGDGVIIGPVIVDSIRANGYQGQQWVMADVSMVSLSARGFPGWPMIDTGDYGQRPIAGKYRNAQIGGGLGLCFEGMYSDSGNCGRVTRANTWTCCDQYGTSFYFSCIDYPSGPGDSGGPVYQPSGVNAIAVGMVSSAVTINGVRMTCFSTVESMEYIFGSSVVTW